MKKIVIGEGFINLQDIDALEDGEEVEIELNGNKTVKKIKKTELFKGEVVRVFQHRPNSYEFGKVGNRHKIYYYSEDNGLQKVKSAKKLETEAAKQEGGE